MITKKFEINFGQHDLDKIDVCSSITRIAGKYKDCQTNIVHYFKDANDNPCKDTINLKSILGVTTLLWEHGTSVEIEFDGPGAEECAQELEFFLAKRYAVWHDKIEDCC